VFPEVTIPLVNAGRIAEHAELQIKFAKFHYDLITQRKPYKYRYFVVKSIFYGRRRHICLPLLDRWEIPLQKTAYIQCIHNKKLCSLGSNILNLDHGPKVVLNQSNRTLSQSQYSALNNPRQYGILPCYFDALSIQPSFEKLYKDVRWYLHRDRIELKRMLISFYTAYTRPRIYIRSNRNSII